MGRSPGRNRPYFSLDRLDSRASGLCRNAVCLHRLIAGAGSATARRS